VPAHVPHRDGHAAFDRIGLRHLPERAWRLSGIRNGCLLLDAERCARPAADADQTRTLTITAIGTPNPINGPKDFAKCTWTPTTRFPTTGDFNLNQQSGFSTQFQAVDAKITISDLLCTGTIPTTTTTTTTTTTSSTTTTTTLPQLCGDIDHNGVVQTSDALNVLRAGVGLKQCALCVCDVDGSGSIGASDGLTTLKKAVGLAITLHCLACN